jgi:hypothetical protein
MLTQVFGSIIEKMDYINNNYLQDESSRAVRFFIVWFGADPL